MWCLKKNATANKAGTHLGTNTQVQAVDEHSTANEGGQAFTHTCLVNGQQAASPPVDLTGWCAHLLPADLTGWSSGTEVLGY